MTDATCICSRHMWAVTMKHDCFRGLASDDAKFRSDHVHEFAAAILDLCGLDPTVIHSVDIGEPARASGPACSSRVACVLFHRLNPMTICVGERSRPRKTRSSLGEKARPRKRGCPMDGSIDLAGRSTGCLRQGARRMSSHAMALRCACPTLCAEPLYGCVSMEGMPIAGRQISAHGSPGVPKTLG